MSSLRGFDGKVEKELIAGRVYFDGMTLLQSWAWSQRNSHPILGLCLHHKRHPMGRRSRIGLLLVSISWAFVSAALGAYLQGINAGIDTYGYGVSVLVSLVTLLVTSVYVLAAVKLQECCGLHRYEKHAAKTCMGGVGCIVATTIVAVSVISGFVSIAINAADGGGRNIVALISLANTWTWGGILYGLPAFALQWVFDHRADRALRKNSLPVVTFRAFLLLHDYKGGSALRAVRQPEGEMTLSPLARVALIPTSTLPPDSPGGSQERHGASCAYARDPAFLRGNREYLGGLRREGETADVIALFWLDPEVYDRSPGGVAPGTATSISQAVHDRDLPRLRHLLTDKKLSPMDRDKNGHPAVATAVRLNLPTMVDALLKAGAHPDAHASGCSLIHVSSAFGFDDVTRVLIDHGADVNLASQRQGGRPVVVAALSCCLSTLLILLDHGKADVNGASLAGWTPLHFAAKYDYVEMAEALFARGADINLRSFGSDGKTPLGVAVAFGKHRVARLLRMRGAKA